MAISWGSLVGGRIRLGVEFIQSPGTVTASTSSVSLTARVHVQTPYSLTDTTNTLKISGSWSWTGTASISHSSGSTTRVYSGTITVPVSYTSTTRRSISATLTGIEVVGLNTPITVAASHTVGRRPVDLPHTPGPLTVERESDTRHIVRYSATNPGHTANPTDRLIIERYDSNRGSWRDIATVYPQYTTYTDQGTVPNERYQYGVRARNAVGDSPRVVSEGWTYTTPAAASDVQAAKNAGDITITWRRNDAYGTAYDIYDAPDGGEFVKVGTAAGTATEFTHMNPDPSVTHTYRVQAVAGTVPGVMSASSNTVQLLTAPAAPSQLAPSAGAFDATKPATFTWRHNAIDTTGQSAYEHRYRVVGASAWTSSGKIASRTQARTFAANTFSNGRTYEWMVRTWGDHADASPWSAAAVYRTSAAPSATVTTPGQTVISARTTASWTYYDPEGTAQSAYRVRLETSDGIELYSVTRTSSASSHEIPTVLADQSSYVLFVAVRDGEGVWSAESQLVFSVEYAQPGAPTVDLYWDLDSGAVMVSAAATAAQVETANLTIARKQPDGTWKVLADNLPTEVAVTDPIPPLDQDVEYRVTATSSIGSERDTIATVHTKSRGWVYVNHGQGFTNVTKVRDNASVEFTPGQEKVRKERLGRTYPTEIMGERRTGKVSLSAQIGGGSSTYEEWEDLTFRPAPLCYRDPFRKLFVSVDPVSTSFKRIKQTMSVAFEQVHHVE